MYFKKKEFEFWLVNGQIRHWKAVITGPEKSCYEGGKFQVDIQIPDKYPYKPLKMKFDTNIWHPNISS